MTRVQSTRAPKAQVVRIEDDSDENMCVEAIFKNMVARSTGGTFVNSQAPPALSVEFVRSNADEKARPNKDGAFAELIFPSSDEIDRKFAKKHGDALSFGYKSTKAADIFPAGYGERSARALAREDNVYQLKGAFPSAVLAVSKLRARVESRKGDVEAINRIFAKMWGVDESRANELPVMHVEGSEAPRLSAMEDRAYHALAGHPAYTGGFRVDTATVSSDAIGSNVPLNWPRLRTGLKTVALIQKQADLELGEMMENYPSDLQFKFTMGIVKGSQPVYQRSTPWEVYLDGILASKPGSGYQPIDRVADIGSSMRSSFVNSQETRILAEPAMEIATHTENMAKLITKASNRALEKTIDVLHFTSNERALIDEEREEDFDELHDAELSCSFPVPQLKLTRSTMRVGVERENLGRDNLPDIRSQGIGKMRVKMDEFRSADIVSPMTVPSALNMAVYIVMQRRSTAIAAYKLLSLVKDPEPGTRGSVAHRLRQPKYFRSPEVLKLGNELFGEEFMGIFETLLRNSLLMPEYKESTVREDTWYYLCNRTNGAKRCPISGGWRDLIAELRTIDEGWTLYYWARISVGKLHYVMNSNILAPIAAGESVDFLTLMRKSVKERAIRWHARYVAEHQLLVHETEERNKKKKLMKKKVSAALDSDTPEKAPYIPPHLRQEAELDMTYDEERILNRAGGYEQEEYMRMVLLQTKAKFFGKIEVMTLDRTLTVGLSDEETRQMFIEFYQARWFSLEKRINQAKSEDKVFRLGPHEFEDHPWGPLITEFSHSHQTVIRDLGYLDYRGWTVNPLELWERLKSSINELWEDLAAEIDQIKKYASEVAEVQVDEQAERTLLARSGLKIDELAGVTPIVIPTPGYRSAPSMPSRPVVIKEDETEKHITYTGESYLSQMIMEKNKEDEEDALGEIESFDAGDMGGFSDMLGLSFSDDAPLQAMETVHLTYREIWDELGMDPISDDRMRVAFGLGRSIDLDKPHLNPDIGPLVTFEDRPRIRKLWASRVEGIHFRIVLKSNVDVNDDM
jgi:hypothetical protein